jgi:hypothetical protein
VRRLRERHDVPPLQRSEAQILLDRFTPLLVCRGDVISWLADRLAGKRTSSNCWAMPIQP